MTGESVRTIHQDMPDPGALRSAPGFSFVVISKTHFRPSMPAVCVSPRPDFGRKHSFYDIRIRTIT